MGMMAKAEPIGGRLPSEEEQRAAKQLQSIIAATKDSEGSARLTVVNGRDGKNNIALMPSMTKLLVEMLDYIGDGKAVTLVPIEQKLSTQEAADILNVSRPYLIKLLERGDIPFEKVGRHRRVKAEHVFDYKAKRDQRREQALAEMARDNADYL